MQQELKHSLDLSIWYKINQMWKLIVFVIGPLLAVQSTEQQVCWFFLWLISLISTRFWI